MATYRIIRSFRPDKQENQPKNLPTGMSLDEAKAYCSNSMTKGDYWFDTFTEE